MCGILGIYSLDNTLLQTEHSLFNLALNTMSHRGPDAQEVWGSPEKSVRLGHLRLSIIDPNPSGTQPMHFTHQGVGFTITYNGEVYNYIEIRQELIKLGYTFDTDTDTEVVLKAYIAWGSSCTKKFNGMFAFAIYEHHTKNIFLVRDRLGIKPLYYHIDPLRKKLTFGSEIKALKPLIEQDTSVDPYLLHQYMQLGYIPGEDTLNKGVKRLLPGHSLSIVSGVVELLCYWKLSYKKPTNDIKPFDYYRDRGMDLLNSSLDLRLRSDVPLGVFLSGGLDSSALVALLSKKVDKPIQTFSVGYEFGQAFDESVYANKVAEKFKTEHHEIKATPKMFEDFLPTFIKAMDEPVTEAAAISLHFVSDLAKKDVTVVLSGEGSDEIFGGYELYQRMGKIEQYHNTLGKTLTHLINKTGQCLLPTGNKLKKYLAMGAKPFNERYRGISVYDNSYTQLLYKPEFLLEINQEIPHNVDRFYDTLSIQTEQDDVLNKMLGFDTRTWLVDDLLIKADRMSMLSSLELRVPFLDHRLVEFAAKLPTQYKIHQGEGKYILKKMMHNILPDEIIYREKMGFPTPLKMMFQGQLRDYTLETLTNNALIHTYFNVVYIKKLCKEHFSGARDHHRILWQLIVIEEWLKNNQ